MRQRDHDAHRPAAPARWSLLVACGLLACGGQLVEYPLPAPAPAALVVESSAAAQSVSAPDYALSLAGLTLLVDADDVVRSAAGAAALTTRAVAGQGYAVVAAAGLDSIEQLQGAYDAAAAAALTADIPAAAFGLVGESLSTPAVRTLIIVNRADGVGSYQAFRITFVGPR